MKYLNLNVLIKKKLLKYIEEYKEQLSCFYHLKFDLIFDPKPKIDQIKINQIAKMLERKSE